MGENLSGTSTGDTLQLSLGADQPHNNRTLFSDHYLEKLLPADPRWVPALTEAGSLLAWLQDLYLSERNQLAGYNEALGWNEEAFKAFVKALVRSMPNLSDLVRVYRKYHPRYYELVGRTAKTDYLIDRIVYQLYGLTEEEIAIEGGEG